MTAPRIVLLAALVVAPTLALAQVITITESRDQDRIINVAECSGGVTDQLSFTWTVTTTSLTGSYDLLASDQAGCPLPTSNTTTTAHTVTIATSITQTGLTNFIGVPTLLGQLSITCPGPATSVNFCLFPSGTAGSTGGIVGGTTAASATGSLTLDLQTPPPPVANAPSPGDSAVTVSWSQGTGAADAGTAGAAASYNVYCDVSPAPMTGNRIDKKCASVTGTGTTSARITGLQNGTAYDFQVTAVSIGGNESDPSNTVPGTPIEVDDFWRLYRGDGGREQGGCATGAAGLAALVALIPLAFRRRGRRS